ncbi:MAG: dTMP kinase, partial [Thermodesulfobacteriota bacterium]|nr:dTMP kinase [Thermodesulfobacteriota bacterium]
MFEGIDGSGKSTQVKLLAENLRQKGLTAVLTSEPSLGPVGRTIRSLVRRLAPEEEMKLFTEDRKDRKSV